MRIWEGKLVYLETFIPPASLPSNPRAMREVGCTIRRGANIPRAEYDKGRIEGQKQKIQKILDTLPVSVLRRNTGIGEGAPQLLSGGSPGTTTAISIYENGRVDLVQFVDL